MKAEAGVVTVCKRGWERSVQQRTTMVTAEEENTQGCCCRGSERSWPESIGYVMKAKVGVVTAVEDRRGHFCLGKNISFKQRTEEFTEVEDITTVIVDVREVTEKET